MNDKCCCSCHEFKTGDYVLVKKDPKTAVAYTKF